MKVIVSLTGLEFSRGPVNEDVFAAPATAEGKTVDSDIQDITEQIHRLLLQVSYYWKRKWDNDFVHREFKCFKYVIAQGNYVSLTY